MINGWVFRGSGMRRSLFKMMV